MNDRARVLATETGRPVREVTDALRELDRIQLGDRDAALFIRQMARAGRDVYEAARALHALPKYSHEGEGE